MGREREQMGEKLHMPAHCYHPSLFLFSRDRALFLPVIINVVALGGGGGDDISPTIKRDTSLRSGISRHCSACDDSPAEKSPIN